jgi:two-component system, chemotaxis family, CheB/CheR fusion protein
MNADPPLTKMNPGPPFPIIGIGASAGGLDALQRFLSVLPKNFDFALIFIQHLSSRHKSLLQELLSARLPSLVIQETSDGLKAQPGRLYLSPPGKEVRLRKGLFQTTVHTEGLIHLPIDEFLTSLAEDAGDRSIAVIFSGAGTDGARGCQAVRSAGGMVFVQDPQTAEFNSMPLAAIATGQADAVLSPEDIAAELLKLQGLGQAAVSREDLITSEEFNTFFRLLQEKTGSRFSTYKKGVLNRRIRRRMYLHGLSTVKDYLDIITTSDLEASRLASDLMIGVTSFFRDQAAWKALHLEAVRKITSESTNVPIRVWTPASATGEEAYSIVMMLLRELALAGKKRDIQVFASDVNDRALEHAREGKYPASITADVPQEYVQKYFTSTDDGNFLVVSKDVRECVVFAKQDLLNDPPFSKLDLIICRNFLIYLEPEAQEKSITLFHYALKEGGYLFLGNAETVGRKSALFKSVGHKQCRVFRKLEMKPASRLPISVAYAAERQVPTAKQAQTTEQLRSVMEVIQEKLLEGYGPAAVAIDQNYEIIYHNGPTKRYLSQPRGVPTQNLLELLPESLRSRIRGALYQSGREQRPVVIRTSVADDENCKRQILLHITKAQENLYIVVFQEKGVFSKEEAAEQVDAAVIEETAIHQLENELVATRSDLQSHIEQLKSMNEEFHSSNEELKAANEELETSREELQSLNEELITVNSQLQGKIEEQDATNNDLNNFQASTNIPTIFLDTHFHVKRFTPAMLKLIKLLPSDVGRPIVDMSQENLGPDLTSDAQSVLKELTPLRRELEISGAWYVRTILPYRTADNRIEGFVVTYNDVSELKRAEERTRHLASFPQLNPNPIIEVDASGKVIFANPGTERILESLGLATGEVLVFLPKDLNIILKDLVKSSESSVSREITVKDRVFSETIYLVPQINVARIYAFDITERKRAEEEAHRLMSAIKEEKERLSSLLNSIADEVWFADINRKFTLANPSAVQEFSLSSSDGGDVAELAASLEVYRGDGSPRPVEDAPPLRALAGEVIRGEDEIIRTPGTGQLRHRQVSSAPVHDAKGRIIGSISVVRDITDRVQADEALRRSEKQYRELFENMIEGFAYCKMVFENGKPQDFIYLSVNHAFEKLTGLKDVVGKRVTEVIPGIREADPELFETYSRVSLTGKPERFEMFVEALKMWFAISVYSPEKEFFVAVFDVITERKKAEEAQGHLAAIIESAEDAIIGKDLNGIIQTWNVGAENIFGYKAEEVIGKPISLLVPPGHIDEVPEVLARIKQGEHIENFETVRMRKDGTIIPVSLTFSAIKDTTGKIIGASKIAHDITARKQTEEALREREERLLRFYESSLIGVIYWNMNGVLVDANDKFLQMVGYTRQDLVTGRLDWINMTPPEYRYLDEQSAAELKAVGVNKKPLEKEYIRKDGTRIPIIVAGAMLDDARFNGVAFVLDITERKRAEESLRNSEALYRSIGESIDYGVWVCDPDGRNTYASESFLKMVGITQEQCSNFGWGNVLHPDDAERTIAAWQECVRTGGKWDIEHRFRGVDGQWHHVLARGVPVKNEQGEIISWAGINLDISRLKKAETDILKLSEDMAARNVELELANKEMEAFIYSVSHDLRAPLRTMSGFSKMLIEDFGSKLENQPKDYLMRIANASEKMTGLIEDLLRLSRISKQDMDRMDYDLSRLASSIATGLREANPVRSVEFAITEGLRASVDPNLIRVALVNLLENSWKFTSKKTNARIEVNAFKKDRKIVYYVRDNGAGFDPTYADKMFLPFQRLHTEKEFEGTGIGLAIVERIIHRHSGSVWAEGEVGKGATVYFTLEA